jgi:CRP/FNR family transcriptional regulator
MTQSITMPSRIVFGPKSQGLGELWSNIRDVCELLKIEAPLNLDKDLSQFQHRRFKAGQMLHLPNDALDNLFLVNCGFLKSSMTDDNGNELVLNFPMKGDLIGVDSIHRQHHQSATITLSDCDIILIPYSALIELTEKYVPLGHALLEIMSRELARERYILGAQRTLSAEAKVGRFLCMMGERYAQLGYSSRRFNLRMSRNEIANYLGLAIETISRVLCVFHRLGVITVNQREVVIIDADFLRGLLKLSPNRNRPMIDASKKTLKNEKTDPDFSIAHLAERSTTSKTTRVHLMQSA